MRKPPSPAPPRFILDSRRSNAFCRPRSRSCSTRSGSTVRKLLPTANICRGCKSSMAKSIPMCWIFPGRTRKARLAFNASQSDINPPYTPIQRTITRPLRPFEVSKALGLTLRSFDPWCYAQFRSMRSVPPVAGLVNQFEGTVANAGPLMDDARFR